ncbi:MAG: amidohydrolase family protein, partial [Mesonia sp.]|uniref:amidohydrolase family protein n=1 Tax=Mesonia sp. TaxID=1960830 RepID=UPI003F972EA2
MRKILIKNTKLVNEGVIRDGEVYIEDDLIKEVADIISVKSHDVKVIDAEGQFLLPGVIDDQVHFREPGLTHKEDIAFGSRAAVAGGITSFIEMPNTNPQTVTIELLEEKFDLAKESSVANYSFMFGGTNDNLEEIKKINPKNTPALKLFLGSSTGNMLVDDEKVLEEIFKNSPVLIAVHCEDEQTIKDNLAKYKKEFGDDIPMVYHPKIRSTEACYLSSSKAVKLAKKTGARLHVFHISTAKEISLFDGKKALKDKKITAEVCIHHLWFNDTDYEKKGTRIKWNPAVKTEKDQKALFKAL